MYTQKYLLCIDLEATCWHADQKISRNDMEIIEIGCIVIKGTEEVAHFSSFVKPQVHTELSKYCKDLTHITQDDVDRAGSFIEVADRLADFVDTFGKRDDIAWCSWGAFDRFQFEKDCERHNIDHPLEDIPYFNVRTWDAMAIDSPTGRGLAKAIKAYGLTFPGQHHRALSDARAVSILIPEIRLALSNKARKAS